MQQFNTISDPDEIHQLEMGNFRNLNFHIYWKDLNNKYWGANDRLALDVGLSKGTDVVDYSDLEFWPHEVDCLKSHDAKVVHDNKTHIFFESGTMSDGATINAVSHKAPWYSKTGKILGIQGLSFVSIEPVCTDTMRLTARQLDCLFYFVKGFTFKQIAKQLNLSPRTIEHYLEAIKLKLNCHTRADLISKSLQLQAIKERL